MKRPGGFDPPERPAEPPASDERPRRRGDAGPTTPASTTPTPPSSASATAAVTIDLSDVREAKLRASPEPADGAEAALLGSVPTVRGGVPRATDRRAGAGSDAETDVEPDGEEGPRPDWRAVRSARRRRRRAERVEIRRFTGAARRRRRTVWVVLGTVGALAAFVLIAGFTPIMAVRTIEVTGTSRLPVADVTTALSDQLGVPLTLVDEDRVRAELGAFSLVESFSVQARPPGTLVVSIVERTPLVSVATPGAFDLMDVAGVVIERTEQRPAGFPTAVDVTGIPTSEGFRALVSALAVMPADLVAQIDTITATGPDDVRFVLTSGPSVVWGSDDEAAVKAVILQRLLTALAGQSFSFIDVSSTDAPVYR